MRKLALPALLAAILAGTGLTALPARAGAAAP